MKKSMFSKLTAYVVTLCMLLSMFSGMTLSVNAADTVPVSTPSEKHNANQLDGITLMKKAEPNDDGTVDISIGAYTTGEVRVTSQTTPTDIVLVLDASGSMAEDITVPVISSYNPVYGYEYSGDGLFDWWVDYYGFDDSSTYYVDLDGMKIPVTKAGTDSNEYDYYTDGMNYYYPVMEQGESNNQIHNYPVVQFYSAVVSSNTVQNKMETLQKGAEAFIRKTALKNDGIENDADKHTITIIKYANENYHNGNSSTNTPSLVPGNNSGYTQVVHSTAVVTGDNVESLVAAVKSISPYGATAIDYGLRLATEVLAAINKSNSGLDEQQDRAEAVIAFSDGSPTHSNGFEDSVANSALSYAHGLKSQGVSVYTISMAEGANSSVLGTDNTNRFMHYLSGNYPDATSMSSVGTGDIKAGYYMTPDGDQALEAIFDSISSSIGVPHVAMGSEAVVTDAISSYFDFVDGTESIEIKTVAKTADGWAEQGVADSKVSYTLGEDGKTVKVTGFDFDENYVSVKGRGESEDFYGKMLLITMHVKPNGRIIDAGASIHNGTVRTNAGDAYVSDSRGISRAVVESPELSLAKITYSVTTEGADKAEYAVRYRLPGTVQSLIADAAKEGYSFGGWDSDDVAVSDGGFTMPNAHIEFTGNFTANEYSVTYRFNNPKPEGADAKLPPALENVKFGTEVTVADKPVIEGYDFVGWRTLAGEELVIEDGRFKMPARNVTLVGHFEPSESTPYRIEHYLQNLDGTTYTLDPRIEGKIGKTGEPATAVPRESYTGFTYDSSNENEVKTATIKADGTTVLKLYYNRNKYKVSYLIDGVKPDGITKPDDIPEVMFGAEVTVADNLSAEGYEFSGWRNDTIPTDPNYVEIIPGEEFTMPAANVIISGVFSAADGVPYTVEHYLENLDGSYGDGNGASTPAKTEDEDEGFTGKTGSPVSAKSVEFTGFTYDPDNENEVAEGTIAADGSTVLKLYYTRDTYTLSYDYFGVLPQDAPALPNGGTYKHGETVTIADKAVAPAGYDFHGWMLEETETELTGTFTMPMRNVVLVGHFHAHGNVPYRIEHYRANVDGTYPEQPSETPETRPGTTDTDATVFAHKYTGFELDTAKTEEVNGVAVGKDAQTNDSTLTMTIKGDGSLVFKFYYKRIPYDVTYEFVDMIPEGVITNRDAYTAPQEDVPYGTEVTVHAINPDDYKGFIFSGWTTDNEHVTLNDGKFTMPAGDVHFKASFVADLNKYTINHWRQNLNGDTSTGVNVPGKGWYTQVTEDTKTYTDRRTGALVEAIPNEYDGFAPRNDNVLTGRIGPDGLVLDVYYDRLTYDVTYIYYDDGNLPDNLPDIPASYQKKNVQYGTKVYVEDGMELENYSFDGWYTISANVHTEGEEHFFTMPNHNVIFSGRFVKDPVVIYPKDDGGDEPAPEPGEDVVERGKYIIVNPNGGKWNHEGQEYTVSVKLLMENDRDLGIAERDGYIFTGWRRTDGTETDVVYVYTAQWEKDKIGGEDPDEEDGGSDDVPDKYQKKVIFKVINGIWKDGTSADIETIVDLLDKDGKYSESGTAAITVPDGMTPVDGYETPGNWIAEPPATVSGTNTETFTFVFHKTPDVVYEEYDEDEPEPEPQTEEYALNDYIRVIPNGGTWTHDGSTYTDSVDLVLTDNIQLASPVREGYKFMGWLVTDGAGETSADGNGTIVDIYTAQWAEDEIGGDNPDEDDGGSDDVADKFQKKVTFKIVNGIWEDGKTDDISYVVDLLKEGKHSKDGSADISAIIPIGMKPAAGYKTGSWDVVPPVTVSGQESVVYTFTFSEKNTYTVVYDLAGGEGADGYDYSNKTVSHGDKIVVNANPTRDNYNFKGWKIGSDEVKAGDEITVTSNITIVATWDKKGGSGGGGGSNSYILTYESNGGTEYANEKYARNTIVVLDKVPEKDGYEFKGWCSDKKLENVIDTIKMTRSLTVYAKWVKEGDDGSGGHHVPGKLDGDNHFAYVIGYPDGTVRPEANITRAEVASIFFRLLVEDVREENLTSSNEFKDFTSDEWYNKAVSTLAALDIIKGKTSDIFAADDNITRAEFAAICARFDDSEFEVVHKFNDVDNHWAADEIHEAIAHGWINGYEDGTFRPDQLITRAEAMTLINRVLSRIPETKEDLLDDMITWVDNADTSAWYYLAIQEATNSHTYFYKDNTYETWRELEAVTDWAAYQK